MKGFNVRRQASDWRLFEPESSGRLKVIHAGDEQNLHAFAEMCHRLVSDRPMSFTLKDRIKLYRHWLASGQPCLVAAHDGRRHVLAASIILPLTPTAFHAVWFEGLDALDIGVEHIIPPGNPQQHRHFLIDYLASNKHFITTMPQRDRHSFYGIGFRTLFYHLSVFYVRGQAIEPALVCSTSAPELITPLHIMGLEQKTAPDGSQLFCIDYHQRDSFPADTLWLVDGTTALMRGYVERRRV